MRKTPRKAAWVLAAALLAFSATASLRAHAQEALVEEEGAVLALDDADLVLDLGTLRGATEGALVEIWRPIKLKHPVTGKVVVDRFRIGTLKLGQVRKHMALARQEGSLTRPPHPGDVVVLHRTAPPKAPAKPQKDAPKSDAPKTDTPKDDAPKTDAPKGDAGDEDPAAKELSELFTALRGADLPTRIRKYEDLVRKDPKGKFAVVLYEEAQQLRRLLGEAGEAKTAASKGPRVLGWELPRAVVAGSPLSLGVEMIGAEGGVLHVKRPGDPQYTSFPLGAAGKGYWTATVPKELVTAPGFEVFVEATAPGGAVVAVLGAADKPVVVEAEKSEEQRAAGRPEAFAALWTDYAHYNSPSKNNDYLWQTEAVFGTRYGDTGFRALRSGFGVYRGASGSIDELDVQKRDPRRVGLTYGHVELEYAPQPSYAFIGRGILGLDDGGISGGVQGFVRVGHDKKTNLLVGGEALGAVGLRGIVQLEWRTIPRVPIVLRTEVTNQPAGVRGVSVTDPNQAKKAEDTSDVGARAIVQVGYQIDKNVELSLRGSYQGRTINHAGPGVGAGVSYTW